MHDTYSPVITQVKAVLASPLKNEFFYNQDWKDVTIEEFSHELDLYLHWYNEKRIKKSLGYLSPVEYRRSLGLVA